MSVMILGCEWQKSAQTGFRKESARCTGFQHGSSVSSIFRNPFILGLLSPWGDKMAIVVTGWQAQLPHCAQLWPIPDVTPGHVPPPNLCP